MFNWGVFGFCTLQEYRGARVQGGSWGYVSLLAGDERRLFAFIKGVNICAYKKRLVGFCWWVYERFGWVLLVYERFCRVLLVGL